MPGMPKHRETPLRRTNPSGATVWVARYTAPDGRRLSAGTYKLKRDAQDAIDGAYDRPQIPTTIGAYAAVWIKRYPRSERTNVTNEGRIRQLLDVKVEGRTLKHWPMRDLRRRHAVELVDHMLRKQHRATTGAQNILRAFSALAEDAITDELCDVNPFKGVRVRSSDQRATKQRRQVRVFSWEQMHAVAAAAGEHEAMIRMLSDCGLRVGELFALRRADLNGSSASVQATAWEGVITESTREKNHDRTVPIPPSLVGLLRDMPTRIDSQLAFPTLRGKAWRYNNWRRDVWNPATKAAGIDMRPHEMRHSFISLLTADGIDAADLAAITGHNVETMVGTYTHPLQRSFDDVRRLVG